MEIELVGLASLVQSPVVVVDIRITPIRRAYRILHDLVLDVPCTPWDDLRLVLLYLLLTTFSLDLVRSEQYTYTTRTCDIVYSNAIYRPNNPLR